jgi:hypothetical protein
MYRKCGRVVCASCSPHRITIPRQYIVQPPTIDLTRDDDATSPLDNMWGGEEVRVCNPCVPDPNLSPPPQHLYGHLSGWPGENRPGPPPRGHRSTQSDTRLFDPQHARASYNPFSNPNLSFQSPSSVNDLFPPPRTSSTSSGTFPHPAVRHGPQQDPSTVCPHCLEQLLPPHYANHNTERLRRWHIEDCPGPYNRQAPDGSGQTRNLPVPPPLTVRNRSTSAAGPSGYR